MKKDLPENIVEDVAITVVFMSETPEQASWSVYLVNYKKEKLENVLVSSKGYGEKDGKKVKTSVLRHSLRDVEPMSYVVIEAIDPAVFGLTNEYLLSFYINGTIYDKKFIFLPESIIDVNIMHIPLLNKPGVMIK
jgi:hypothetical protein